jgi:pimeloyl-ACP methyl ester carboxylesterase
MAQAKDAGGFDQVLRQLDDDMAAYVARNAVRERVRDFVAEVLIRLAYRDEVTGIVVNAHSQGTVAAYDALRRTPRSVPRKVRCLVTAGSPLRKYVTSLTWGFEVGAISAIPRWLNYYDQGDPVADPLRPPMSWHPGDPIPDPMPAEALFEGLDIDREVVAPVDVLDRPVDNRANSSAGGLQAHNYWDNRTEFVSSLAGELLAARRTAAEV